MAYIYIETMSPVISYCYKYLHYSWHISILYQSIPNYGKGNIMPNWTNYINILYDYLYRDILHLWWRLPMCALCSVEITHVCTILCGDYPCVHYLVWDYPCVHYFVEISHLCTILWRLPMCALLLWRLPMCALLFVEITYVCTIFEEITNVCTTFVDYPCVHYFLWTLPLWALLLWRLLMCALHFVEFTVFTTFMFYMFMTYYDRNG